MSGAITPLPNTPSRRHTQLRKKHRDNFTFTFYYPSIYLELTKTKVKAELHLCFWMSTTPLGVRGSGGIAPHIPDLGTRWRWVVSITRRPLYFHGKSPWYPLDRRLSGPQKRSGRGKENKKKKNAQPLPGLEPPIIQAAAQRYTIELSRHLRTTKKDPKEQQASRVVIQTTNLTNTKQKCVPP
jgi:hypothetical protein